LNINKNISGENILRELTWLLSPVLPVETGVFSDEPPDAYIVLTPMNDEFDVFADNMPLIDINEVRISVFIRGNYLDTVGEITRILLKAGFTITLRRFIELEPTTRYNHYVIDVIKLKLLS